MRLTLLLALLATAATAGPVGRYLGFEVNRQGDALGASRDSIHNLLPSPGDTIIVRSRVDTTTIVAETVRLGNPAWVIKQVTNPTQDPEPRRSSHENTKSDETNLRPLRVLPFRVFRVFVAPTPVSGLDAGATDTSYESGDTLLCSRQVLGDSIRWLNAYRVPFSIGTTWRFGLAGTYIYDFTGDTIMDTLNIWTDTCTVLDTEDVTVPYGTVPHCFKIRRVMRQRLAAQQSGFPVIESSYIRTFEWYKDSLWSVKESTQASGSIYTKVVIWLHAADFVSTDVSQLNDLGYLGLAAQPHTVHRNSLTVSPNPFRSSAVLHLTTGPRDHMTTILRIFDAQGRLVLSQPVRTLSFPLSTSNLPPGAYFIRAGNEVYSVAKVR